MQMRWDSSNAEIHVQATNPHSDSMRTAEPMAAALLGCPQGAEARWRAGRL